MSLSDIFQDPKFLIGIVVTVILGIIGIIYTIRIKLSEITFYPSQFIYLVDNLLSEYNDIKISYKNKSIDKNLSFFKGIFINTGKDDINFENAEKNLTIKLPNDCNIIKAEITSKSENLRIDITKSLKNEIEFEAGLLKKNEFFQIEAIICLNKDFLANSKKSQNIYNVIDFDHRVRNLNKIKKLDLIDKSKSSTDSNFQRVIMFLALIFIVFSQAFMNPRYIAPMTRYSKEITYCLLEKNYTDSISVRVLPFGIDSVNILGINEKMDTIVALDDFYNKMTWAPKITKVTDDKSLNERINANLFIAFLLLFSLIYELGKDFYKIRKRKYINNLVDRNTTK